MKKSLLPAALSLIFLTPTGAVAERVCVEEAAGVCLKYREVQPETRGRSDPKPAPAPQPALPTGPDARAEASLSLTRTEYRQIQAGLRKTGHYNGPLDGVLGGGSRAALRNWQAASGFDQTGYLTFDQVIALQDAARGRTAPQPAPQTAEPAQPAAPAPQPETAAAPANPAPGQTYSKTWGKSIAFAVGDMSARLKRLSDREAELEVAYEPVNQRQFRFRDDCKVPLTGPFTCELRGFEGQLLYVTGELPNVHVDGEDIAFW